MKSKKEVKEIQREISFETEGVHIMELEERDEFKTKCGCFSRCDSPGDTDTDIGKGGNYF